MSERRDATEKKHDYQLKFCKLETMKECQFRCTDSQPYKQKLTGDDLLKKIFAGKYFGVVICDIHVPESLKDHFAEMTPIFKNVEVSIEEVGPYKVGTAAENTAKLIGKLNI